VPLFNPDSLRAPKVLTPTLAAWMGRAATTVRAWVRRGILPQPERLGDKTVVHDVAKVLLALSQRIPWGANGYVERKARTAAGTASAPLHPLENGLSGGEEAAADDQADDQADDLERGSADA
jgi:hypothetical protein